MLSPSRKSSVMVVVAPAETSASLSSSTRIPWRPRLKNSTGGVDVSVSTLWFFSTTYDLDGSMIRRRARNFAVSTMAAPRNAVSPPCSARMSNSLFGDAIVTHAVESRCGLSRSAMSPSPSTSLSAATLSATFIRASTRTTKMFTESIESSGVGPSINCIEIRALALLHRSARDRVVGAREECGNAAGRQDCQNPLTHERPPVGVHVPFYDPCDVWFPASI